MAKLHENDPPELDPERKEKLRKELESVYMGEEVKEEV